MSDGPAAPWRLSRQGISIAVRLTPNAPRDEVAGIVERSDGPRLAVKVRAVPDKGKANQALLAVLANWLELPKSQLKVTAGSKSREKLVAVEGVPEELGGILRKKLERE